MNTVSSPFYLANLSAVSESSAVTSSTAASTTGDAPLEPPASSPFAGFMPLVILLALLYFIMIRPAQRKEKQRRKEISELRSGARILFAGGIIGTIQEVKSATFLVKVYDGSTLEIARGAVIRTLKDDETPGEVESR